MLDRFAATVDAATTTGFSGVISVRTPGHTEFEAAFGDADRERGIPNTPTTRFGLASGTKSLTALAVMRLIGADTFELHQPVRELLGPDLPLIDDAVTPLHLLSHTSGIGDYVDEDVIEDREVWPGTLPPSAMTSTAAYLADLGGRAQKFAPGTAFSYCNSGYVVLALLCERATGTAWPDLLAREVIDPAGLTATGYSPTNPVPDGTAIGYRDDGRTNDGLLPAQGSGDGGLASTLDDIDRLWRALFAGNLVPADTLEIMLTPGPFPATETMQYGLGFWLDPQRSAVELEGCDAGISFRSIYDPGPERTTTIMSNTTDGAWPVARVLAEATAPMTDDVGATTRPAHQSVGR